MRFCYHSLSKTFPRISGNYRFCLSTAHSDILSGRVLLSVDIWGSIGILVLLLLSSKLHVFWVCSIHSYSILCCLLLLYDLHSSSLCSILYNFYLCRSYLSCHLSFLALWILYMVSTVWYPGVIIVASLAAYLRFNFLRYLCGLVLCIVLFPLAVLLLDQISYLV